MKKIFKRVSAAVIALAVAATAVVFDVPGRIIASATSAPPHDIHAVCGDANCDEHQDISNWTWIRNFDGISSGTYYLYGDVTLTDEVTIAAGTDITLCLNGFTITAASGKRIFNINGGSLTLCDCKGTGKLTGGNSSGGGCIRVIGSDSTFTMYGGTISGNTTEDYAGGVYVSNATFTMNGGTISGNSATSNTSSTYGGGGVFINSSGTFTMNGGIISDNTTNGYGGGVYVSNATFTMNGGKISENTATSYGGGVYVNSSGTFTMEDGTISENIANTSGGGVYVTGGTFTMDGGTISGNTANGGGGVYASGTFTMEDGTISGNTAKTTSGGGVYVSSSGTFTMEDGTISSNTAKISGGGVYVYTSGIFTMEDGKIFGNTANTSGGGVYVSGSNATFTMYGGTISGNTANNGGGVYVNSNGTFTMEDGTISENIATSNGGGVYNNGTVTLNGKVDITENKKSDNSANNVYLNTNKTLTIGDSFSTDYVIGVTTATAPTDCLTGTVAVTGDVSSDISGSFVPDVDGQVVVYKESTVHLALHTYSDEWSSDDTNHWHECTSCDDITDEAEHSFVDKSDETNHWKECSVCGYKKDVTEHSWGDWTLTTEPTLTTTGAAERECSYGETQTKTDVPALSDETVWSKDEVQHVEPTEEAEGKDVYTSEYGKITITLDKLPHSLTHIDETPATETEEGVKEHWHCEGCGKNFADENGTTEMTDTDLTIPVIGHTHTLTYVPEVPATETTAGTKEHWHCDDCGKDFADENGTTEMTDTDLTIPVIGHTHTLTHVPEVPATETTEGTKEHWHCEGCGKNFADEDGTTEMTDTDLTIPVIGHTHTLTHVPEVPATETTAGTKEHWHCEDCGKDFADENGTKEVTADDLKIGKLETEVQAPVNVEIATPIEELITAALTEEEQQKITEGTDIKIILKVENAAENISDEDKGKVETEINGLSDYKLGQYLDITLLKKIGEEQEQKITKTNAPIKIIFEIPEGLRGKAEYSVIRVHDGTATVLRDLDSDPNTVTIETDKFSTYALTYKEKTTTSNPSGDNSSGGNSGGNSNPSTSTPNESDNSDATSSDDGNTTSSESDTSSGGTSSSDGSDHSPSESSPSEDNGNPSTGIAVSLIPLVTAAAILTVAVKCKKK